jgi:hypothetical protein
VAVAATVGVAAGRVGVGGDVGRGVAGAAVGSRVGGSTVGVATTVGGSPGMSVAETATIGADVGARGTAPA